MTAPLAAYFSMELAPIGDASPESDDALEGRSLYEKLEQIILPLFHRAPLGYAEVMRAAIAHNGSFFNAQRMVSQYVDNAYRTGPAEA